MVLRPRPGNLLGSSLRQLTNTAVVPLQVSMQWERADETERHFSFGGWISFAGTLDLRDLSFVRANGILGYSPSPSQSDFESANIVLNERVFAFQEKQFKQERSDWLNSMASSSEKGDWFLIDRERLLKETGYERAIAKGSDSELRKILKQTNLRTIASVASSTEQVYAGREYMTIGVRLNEETLTSLFLSLADHWYARKLSETEIVRTKAMAHEAARGDWSILIDEGAGDIVGISGRWYQLDSQDRILGRVTLSMVLGVDQGVFNKIPSDAKDITSAVFPEKKGALPSAMEKNPEIRGDLQ